MATFPPARNERIGIALDPWEFAEARTIAARRADVPLDTNKFPPFKTKPKGYKNYKEHLLGILGEMGAYAHYYGDDDFMEIFNEQLIFGRSDNGIDIVSQGRTCDVKTVQYFNDPVLKISPAQLAKNPDYFMLAVGDMDHGYIELVGYLPREVVEARPLEVFAEKLPESHNFWEDELIPISREVDRNARCREFWQRRKEGAMRGRGR